MNSNSAACGVLALAFLTGPLEAADGDVLFEVFGTPTFLAVSASGKFLAATEGRGHIILWNIPERRQIHDVADARGDGSSLAFSPNDEFLAATTFKSIRLWKVSTGEESGILNGHKKDVRAIDFSHDGKSLASISEDGTLVVWDTADGKVAATFNGHKASVRSLAISADSRTVFSGSMDGSVREWSIPVTSANSSKD